MGFDFVRSFEEGFRRTDVYATSWGAVLTTSDADDGKRIIDKYGDWMPERRMAMANHDAIFMYALPADRNIEVSDAVISGPQSVVSSEAENRLHGHKAVMALTMS